MTGRIGWIGHGVRCAICLLVGLVALIFNGTPRWDLTCKIHMIA